MKKIKRNWDLLSDENKRKSIQEVIDFFHSEQNEEIGIIAAENIVDHFLQTIGIEIYNMGVEDAKNFLKERVESLDIDMESLVKK